MATATTLENVKQSTRIPTKIRLMVTSLEPSVNFAEFCDTVSVNAQGCAMHSTKQIAPGTPVLLRLQTGKEVTGQVAFCKGSPSSDKLWGLGLVLDKPGNFWGLDPCPKDWLVGNEDAAVSPDDRGIRPSARDSSRIPNISRTDADTMRAELREQMRTEMDALLTDARATFERELHAQKKSAALAEALLQDATTVRDSLTVALRSLPETLDRKVANGVESALKQIEVHMNTLVSQHQSESEQLQQQLRGVAEEMDRQVHQSGTAELEKAQHQFLELANRCSEEKRQEAADATASMGQASEQIYASLHERLENEFKGKQEIITSSQNEIATETSRLQAQIESADDRVAKLSELSLGLEANFTGRLEQIASETIMQARPSLEHLLEEVRDRQMGVVRAEVETVLNPVSARADSLIKDLRSFIDVLSRESDEMQIQSSAAKQQKDEMQLWLAQQDQNFRKAIEDALSRAQSQGKASVQKALDIILDPIDKLNCEAKKKIEEVTARQYAELGEGIRSLREELASLQQQAGDSLRASLGALNETPNVSHELMADKPEPDDAEKSEGRGQTTLAQKLSGLVRAHGGKRDKTISSK